MGDSRPLVGDLGIRDDGAAIVLLVEVQVGVAQGVLGQGLTLLCHVVSHELELSELGLAEAGGLDHVHVVGQKILLEAGILGLLQEVLEQQHLVDGAGHLGHEDPIACLLLGLSLLGVVGVEGVTHLVGDGEDVVGGGLVVEQNVGVRQTVSAGRVSAASLALGLLHVDPAVVMGLAEQSLIPLAQGSQTLDHQVVSLLVVQLQLGVLHQGQVEVVHMHLVHAQHLLAVAEVAVEQGQTLIDGAEQVLVHLHVHVLGGQSLIQAGLILARLGQEDILVHVAGVGGGDGIDEADVSLVIGLEDLLTDSDIGVMEQDTVHTVGDGDVLAVHLHRGEGEVGVIQHTEYLLVAAEDAGALGQKRFHFLGEDVGLVLDDALDGVVVVAQAGIGGEGLEGLHGKSGQLGGDEGGGARELHGQHGEAGGEGGELRNTAVLVVTDVGVDGQLIELEHEGVEPFHAGQHVLHGVQLTLELGKVQLALALGVHGVPGLNVLKNILDPPLSFCGYLISVQCHNVNPP